MDEHVTIKLTLEEVSKMVSAQIYQDKKYQSYSTLKVVHDRNGKIGFEYGGYAIE